MKVETLKVSWTFAPILVAALLTACGGGGGGGGGTALTTPSLSISGVAATGAAIIGGTVDATCKTGTGTATTNADGTYTVSVSAGQQPCLLRATDPITQQQLHSFVETGATTANITPITDLVVANTLGADPATAYSNFTTAVQQQITAANISVAVTKVQAATAALGASADMSGIDPMKGTLQAATGNAAGDATDKKIDALMATLAAADKKIADLSAAIKASSTNANAASQLTALVGNAQYSLANCPAARSGDIWILDFAGHAPQAWNVNFSTMILTNLADNSTTAVSAKLDGQSNAIPCAFTAVIATRTVEFRVSDSGLAVWKHNANFGVTIPKQTITGLNTTTFAGSYPSIAYLINKQNGANAAAPFRYEINSSGQVDAYSCDLTKSVPDCTTALTPAANNKTTCTAMSNGTLSCSSADGALSGVGVGFVSGGNATLFLSITDMRLSSTASAGGLIVMTKAASVQLPTAGTQVAAGATWYAGYQPASGYMTGDSLAGSLESKNL